MNKLKSANKSRVNPDLFDLVSTFQKQEAPKARGKYLSRVFGIFFEEIVRIWASDHRCQYEDLGRPTVRIRDEK